MSLKLKTLDIFMNHAPHPPLGSQIERLIGRIEGLDQPKPQPHLCKTKRVRTVHGSRDRKHGVECALLQKQGEKAQSAYEFGKSYEELPHRSSGHRMKFCPSFSDERKILTN